MIRFGHFYLGDKLTVYDVTLEVIQGRRLFVATLSEDPRVSFRAVRAENAVAQLKSHLAQQSPRPAFTPRVTWVEEPASHVGARANPLHELLF